MKIYNEEDVDVSRLSNADKNVNVKLSRNEERCEPYLKQRHETSIGRYAEDFVVVRKPST